MDKFKRKLVLMLVLVMLVFGMSFIVGCSNSCSPEDAQVEPYSEFLWPDDPVPGQTYYVCERTYFPDGTYEDIYVWATY